MNEIEHLQLEIERIDFEIETIVKPIYARRDELIGEIIGHQLRQRGGDFVDNEIGHHWRGEDGSVYEIKEKEGKYVHFDRIGWDRTRRGYLGEKKGSLSKKRAEEVLGYTLGENYDFVEPDENKKENREVVRFGGPGGVVVDAATVGDPELAPGGTDELSDPQTVTAVQEDKSYSFDVAEGESEYEDDQFYQ